MSIVLGYAPLALPSGRRISLIDVPGHERLIRTMVAGATGIDMYLMVVAADDGVMPQTVEHARILEALDVRHGVVAVTKCDLADPARALHETIQLLPACTLVTCSSRDGVGVGDVAAALDEITHGLRGLVRRSDEPLLHVDRVFSVRGAGTVATGTLWSGSIGRGDELTLLPLQARVRVRAVQVHDQALDRAQAGQRVAVNLTGLRGSASVSRGDVLAGRDTELRPSHLLDALLTLTDGQPGEHVQIHHGTRQTGARISDLGGGVWRLRTEKPLLTCAGDRLLVRRSNPPATLGGGTVLKPAAGHALAGGSRGRRGLARTESPRTTRLVPPAGEPLNAGIRALEERLREASAQPLMRHELGDAARLLPVLLARGRVIRIGTLYPHRDTLDAVRQRVEAIIARDGSVTLGGLRDELQVSRRYAQAFLDHFDASRLTLRLPDDRRVLRKIGPRSSANKGRRTNPEPPSSAWHP